MKTLRRVAACFGVAIAVFAVPVLADEILGVLTKIDIEEKKVTIEDREGKETVVTVNDDTQWATPKGSEKADLDKMSKNLERVQSKGRKGMSVKVTHDNGVASKIEMEARKKGGGREKGER